MTSFPFLVLPYEKIHSRNAWDKTVCYFLLELTSKRPEKTWLQPSCKEKHQTWRLVKATVWTVLTAFTCLFLKSQQRLATSINQQTGANSVLNKKCTSVYIQPMSGPQGFVGCFSLRISKPLYTVYSWCTPRLACWTEKGSVQDDAEKAYGDPTV